MMTQITNTKITQDETHLLFDSSYWDGQEIFEYNEYLLGDSEQMFGGNTSIRRNEKYIRDYTIYDFEGYCRPKKGGLVIDGDNCSYKAGYIKPDDVLYYKEDELNTEVKSVDFSELMVHAIHHSPDGGVASMYFAIYFRSIRTGDFYVISYNYSLIYEANEYGDEEYLSYYACKVSFAEAELLKASSTCEISLYNVGHYKSKSRNHKISLVTSNE